MTTPKITCLSCRWFSEMVENTTERDRRAVRSMLEWIELAAPACRMHNAAENYFPARHEDGRYGALLEIELDDDFAPKKAQIEAVEAAVVAPGEFHYLPPGNSEIFNERAGYWVFFPGVFFNADAMEQTAAGIFDAIYPPKPLTVPSRAA